MRAQIDEVTQFADDASTLLGARDPALWRKMSGVTSLRGSGAVGVMGWVAAWLAMIGSWNGLRPWISWRAGSDAPRSVPARARGRT